MAVQARDCFELIRIPGVFTAQADILAGFFIAGGQAADMGRLACLLVATSLLYSAGMALNDFFDHRIDRIERPDRPIPSGRIRISQAFCLGTGLLVSGGAMAAASGPAGAGIGLMLVAFILLYDGKTKAFPWLGPANMAGCRYFNLMLGLSIAPRFPGLILIPAVTGIYIFGVTVLSRQEAAKKVHTPAVLVAAGCIAGACLLMGLFFKTGILPGWAALVLGVPWGLCLTGTVLVLLRKASPAAVQKTVKRLLLNLVVLDGILVAAAGPVWEAALVWVLLIPASVVARRFYVT